MTDRLRSRLLPGPDTKEFCQRISDALDDGYELHGSPTITFNSETNQAIAAQALVLPPPS